MKKVSYFTLLVLVLIGMIVGDRRSQAILAQEATSETVSLETGARTQRVAKNFVQIPMLEKLFSYERDQDQLTAKYYFTFNIPEGANAPLERLDFIMKQGVKFPRFSDKGYLAYQGTRRDRGELLPIRSVTVDRPSRKVSMAFSPPIEPGQRFTVVLRVTQNPTKGTYLYEVRGHALDSQSEGQYLGLGRLDIRSNGFGR